jgi:FkbM family methyltransferase
MKRRLLNMLIGSILGLTRIADAFVAIATGRPRMVAAGVADRLEPLYELSTRYGAMRFATPSEGCLVRSETFYSKEPDTIAWIDEMPEDFVLWDVGANVGIYSIYAGLTGRGRVIAFEPEASNYWVLNRNIHLNELTDRVSGYCVALSEKSGTTRLALRTTQVGDALHTIDGVQGLNDSAPAFHQGCLTISADEAVSRLSVPAPTHIKIDVDGAEALVIAGAVSLLNAPSLVSVLVELDNTDESPGRDVVSILEAAGLSLTSSEASPIATGRFAEIRNYVFTRVPADAADRN